MSSVIDAEAWPSIFCTAFTFAPADTASDAAVCRRSCGVVRGTNVRGGRQPPFRLLDRAAYRDQQPKLGIDVVDVTHERSVVACAGDGTSPSWALLRGFPAPVSFTVGWSAPLFLVAPPRSHFDDSVELRMSVLATHACVLLVVHRMLSSPRGFRCRLGRSCALWSLSSAQRPAWSDLKSGPADNHHRRHSALGYQTPACYAAT
jgi:hypothetical protein